MGEQAWQVVKDGEVIKEFPHRAQCIVWCYENKYVNVGRGLECLQDGIEIKQADNAHCGPD